MVLQVGDKVVVFNVGSDFAFAKKIEPIEVGDKVDVITLSDGTKIPLPRLELKLDDYVFVIPEWDPNFHFDEIPVSWGALPLGAAVFTISARDCHTITDYDREWEPDELANYFLVIISGANKGAVYVIGGNTEQTYSVTLYNGESVIPTWTYEDIAEGGGISRRATGSEVNLVNKVAVDVSWKYNGLAGQLGHLNILLSEVPTGYDRQQWHQLNELVNRCIYDPATGRYHNPDYPDYTVDSAVTLRFHPLSFAPLWAVARFDANPECDVQLLYYKTCDTLGLLPGDKYVIYDPATKTIKFNDATKTGLSDAFWREKTSEGEVIALSAIEYVWDGKGYVYLSASKSIFSTIYFDDEIQVTGAGGTVPYHVGDRISYGGETVSRELVNITSALRAGKNSVVISVRDTGGAKVGFPTTIYIKRNMTAVPL
jgi:hypothetical protein